MLSKQVLQGIFREHICITYEPQCIACHEYAIAIHTQVGVVQYQTIMVLKDWTSEHKSSKWMCCFHSHQHSPVSASPATHFLPAHGLCTTHHEDATWAATKDCPSTCFFQEIQVLGRPISTWWPSTNKRFDSLQISNCRNTPISCSDASTSALRLAATSVLVKVTQAVWSCSPRPDQFKKSSIVFLFLFKALCVFQSHHSFMCPGFSILKTYSILFSYFIFVIASVVFSLYYTTLVVFLVLISLFLTATYWITRTIVHFIPFCHELCWSSF